jgi:SAM-dependent methyltransferase
MTSLERGLYQSAAAYAVNQVLLPAKLLVPQPLIARLPFLKTNQDIRIGIVGQALRGRALDVGCGTNRLMRAYRAQGGEGIGVDVHPWPGVDILVEDTAKLPFPDHSFDSIAFVACLNHIPNRKQVLREARRLLAPGGRILATNLTPLVSFLWHRWAFWDEDQHERGMKDGEVWGFTHRDLVRLFDETGFRVVEKHAFSWGLNALYIAEPRQDHGAIVE